ncbi:hypothetical protein BC828DRAFT_381856 [Blastocladiella britannica]|nr:hypothetical protein BC828DRAFT_381856 [Blastocladiella britannica]
MSVTQAPTPRIIALQHFRKALGFLFRLRYLALVNTLVCVGSISLTAWIHTFDPASSVADHFQAQLVTLYIFIGWVIVHAKFRAIFSIVFSAIASDSVSNFMHYVGLVCMAIFGIFDALGRGWCVSLYFLVCTLTSSWLILV